MEAMVDFVRRSWARISSKGGWFALAMIAGSIRIVSRMDHARGAEIASAGAIGIFGCFYAMSERGKVPNWLGKLSFWLALTSMTYWLWALGSPSLDWYPGHP